MPFIKLFSALLLLMACQDQKLPSEIDSNHENSESIAQAGAMLNDDNLQTMFQDSDMNYWFSGDLGIHRLTFNDGAMDHKLFTEEDGLLQTSFFKIQEDYLGNLYFESDIGINKYDGNTFSTLEINDDPAQANVWKLEPNDLWFSMGWYHDGPFRYDGENLYPLTLPNNPALKEFEKNYPNSSYNPRGLYTVYKDSKGIIWLGTASIGIFRFDGNSLEWLYEKHLTNTPNGGDYGIRSIIEDGDGFLWFTNNRYKYKITPSKDKRSEGDELQYSKERIVIGEEISDDELLYFSGTAKDKKGHLWLMNFNAELWEYDGVKLVEHLLENKEEMNLSSLYVDRNNEVWVLSRDKRIYKKKGNSFALYQFD